MGSDSGAGRDPLNDREAFVAAMKRRIEDGRSRGLSPEEMEADAREFARGEMRRRAPEVVAAARTWWVGLRRFLVIGALAVALSVGLALFAEHRYAAPLCERHAAEHGLQYRGLDYPYLGRSSGTSSGSGRCILADAAGRGTTVSLRKVEPNFAVDFAMSTALEIEFTIPAFFALLALAAASVLRRRP